MISNAIDFSGFPSIQEPLFIPINITDQPLLINHCFLLMKSIRINISFIIGNTEVTQSTC